MEMIATSMDRLLKKRLMNKSIQIVAHAMLIFFSMQTIAHAAPPPPPSPQLRTYISGVGSDSNPCTASSPCRTFQAALALTIAGGQIYVLNSANYGSVTLNKAITIASEGAVAGALATSGAAIMINAGA